MAKPSLPQFEKEYDFYKMRTLVDELNRWIERVESGVVLGSSGLSGGGGGGGVTEHNDLTGRSVADAHPTSAITGLDTALAANAAAAVANALALANINHQEEFFEGMSTRVLIHAEFTDPVGAKVTPNLHAVTAGAGAIIAGSISDPTDHPGIWRMLTGTTVVGRVFILSIAGGVIVGTVRAGSGRIRVGTWLQTSAILSTGIERYTIRSGLFAITLPNIIDEGIGFEYDDSQNGGRWQAICGDAPGVETSVDTGILVAASTWYKLELEVNAAGTSVEFFIDNVSVATIVTNIPTGAPFDLFYNTHIMKLIGVTSREMEIDAMYMYQEINR